MLGQPSDCDNLLWYVAFTKPQSEDRARINFERQGYHTVCPYEMRTIMRSRKAITVKRPYFSRYVFVGVPGRLSIYSAKYTFGVSCIVENAGGPLSIPQNVIDDLRKKIDDNGFFIKPQEQDKPRHRVGEIVKILQGPLEGFLCEIARVDDSEAIQVFVDLFGRRTETILPVSRVTPPAPASAVAVA